jgi:hypothetical protein
MLLSDYQIPVLIISSIKHSKYLLFNLLMIMIGTTTQAYNTIPATGGNATGSGGSV